MMGGGGGILLRSRNQDVKDIKNIPRKLSIACQNRNSKQNLKKEDF